MSQDLPLAFRKGKNFYRTFAAPFARQAKFSEQSNPPALGTDETPYEEVRPPPPAAPASSPPAPPFGAAPLGPARPHPPPLLRPCHRPLPRPCAPGGRLLSLLAKPPLVARLFSPHRARPLRRRGQGGAQVDAAPEQEHDRADQERRDAPRPGELKSTRGSSRRQRHHTTLLHHPEASCSTSASTLTTSASDSAHHRSTPAAASFFRCRGLYSWRTKTTLGWRGIRRRCYRPLSARYRRFRPCNRHPLHSLQPPWLSLPAPPASAVASTPPH